jgi:hypothetical protein
LGIEFSNPGLSYFPALINEKHGGGPDYSDLFERHLAELIDMDALALQVLLSFRLRLRKDGNYLERLARFFAQLSKERSTFRAKVALGRESQYQRLAVLAPVNARKPTLQGVAHGARIGAAVRNGAERKYVLTTTNEIKMAVESVAMFAAVSNLLEKRSTFGGVNHTKHPIIGNASEF